MENQLHTQEELTNPELERIKARERAFKTVKDNLNYIYVFLMIITNAIISLLRVENGKIGLSYPNNGLGWALWITQILVITFIGVLILNSFRRQGILQGHKSIKDTYHEYLEAITNRSIDSNPRSLKEYMKKQTISDALTKGTALILINLLVMSVVVSLNINALISLVVNILFSTCFGIKAMLDAEEYVITELVIWYKLKIKEIKEISQRKERREKNGNQKRNKQLES